jgi:hypothetical protein
MLLSSLAVLVAALPLAVLGGEIPVYNGVIGGAPINVTVNQKVLETLADDLVTQTSVLRYVENSGVCGKIPLLKLLPACMLIAQQKPPPACIQLQAMRT